MAYETYANFASSNLSAPMTAGALTLTVNNGDVYPASGNFRLLIDNELLVCTARAGNTLTVTRGDGGTTANAHFLGALVTNVLSKEALDTIRAETNGNGTWASRAAAALAGRIWWATDGPLHSLDNGSTWSVYGPLWPVVPPVLADFAWVNQGGATIDDSKGPHILFCPTAASDNLRMRVKTKAAPYTLTVGLIPCIYPIDVSAVGILLRESATGKLETLHLIHSTTGKVECNKWTSPTVYSATRASISAVDIGAEIRWLRIINDGTNLTYQFSTDGFNFQTLTTTTVNDFFTTTPDQIGFFGNPNNAGGQTVSLNVFSWKEA